MLSKIKPYLYKLLPIAILIILPFILFYPVFQGKIITAGDFSGSDLLDLHLPFKYALNNGFTDLKLPLWEKNISMGFPLLSEGQSGIFYPVNFLLSVLKPYLSLNLSALVALAVAGVSMYLYMRLLHFTKFSSLFSAIIFSHSAFFITRLKHLNLIAVAAWTPLGFYFIKKAFDSKDHINSIFLGIIIGLQLLAGHPNMTFLCVFIYFIYFIYEIVRSTVLIKRSNDDSPPLLFGITSFILSLVVGIGISAIQLIPTLEFINLSSRQEMSFESASAYPFTLKSLTTFFSPYSFGNPASGSYKLNIYSEGVFWENASYLGLLPFALILYLILSTLWKKIGSLRSSFKKNKKSHFDNGNFLESFLKKIPLFFSASYTRFFMFLAFLSFVLMLGSATPLFKFLWNNVPGFSLFRFPSRFNLFLIMSLSIVSSIVAEKLLKKLQSLKSNYFQIRSGKILQKQKDKNTDPDEEVHISWPLGRKSSAVLLLAFVIADLAVFANSYVAYIDADKFTKIPQMAEKLPSDKDSYRIYSTTQYGESPYQLFGWKNADPILAFNNTIAPNKNLFYNLSSFNDRGWFEGGLSLERRNKIENYLLSGDANQVVLGKLLGLYNVKYIISFFDIPGIEIYKENEVDLGANFGEKIKIFRNDQVLPHVYFVPEAKYVESEQDAFNNVVSLEHLGPKTVILEDKPIIQPEEFNGVLETFKKENPVIITTDENTKLQISAEIKNHGFLVLSDIYYPGWKVFVDGKEDKILRANYLVRAVELNPGKHDVIFIYDPLSFKIGAGVSVFTVTIIFLNFLIQSIKKLIKQPKKHRNSLEK